MSEEKYDTVFRKLYSKEDFVDRFAIDSNRAVDVIIPLIHTNELWEKNLISLYREIPINRLLISNGGCVDDSIEVVKKFPRVEVLDHTDTKSLGYCIRKLIEEVETEWFVYPHSDVYLPDGWFNSMANHQGQYDWFGCPMRHVVIVEYDAPENPRPYAGSQMGKKEAFVKNLNRIDDDYVYRQEDYVFERIVSDSGFKNGKVNDTFHYHQTMHKVSKWGRKVKNLNIEVEMDEAERIRTAETQARGIVKYLEPDKRLANTVMVYLSQMIHNGHTDAKSFFSWIKKTNPDWLPYLSLSKVKLLVMMQRGLFKTMLTQISKLA